jgi:hypothetical protein
MSAVLHVVLVEQLGSMNANFDPRGRWDAVMKDDTLFSVEDAP